MLFCSTIDASFFGCYFEELFFVVMMDKDVWEVDADVSILSSQTEDGRYQTIRHATGQCRFHTSSAVNSNVAFLDCCSSN